MEFIPNSFFIAIAAVFGLIIGSFLNVVIYRLHTGKSLNGNSHCLSCGHCLHWYELVPVLSYIILRGRCSACHSYIPLRYLAVEILTAGAFALAYIKAFSLGELGVLLALLSLLIVGVVYDLYHMIIPDEISIFSTSLGIGWFFYLAYSSGEWSLLFSTLLAGFLPAGFLALLWLLSRGRWIGLGDAKLAFPLGMFVGLSGAFSFVIFSFWIGAIVGLSLVLLAHFFKLLRITPLRYHLPRVRMKSEIPFAPFLIISFVLVYFWSADVLSLSTYVASLLY